MSAAFNVGGRKFRDGKAESPAFKSLAQARFPSVAAAATSAFAASPAASA